MIGGSPGVDTEIDNFFLFNEKKNKKNLLICIKGLQFKTIRHQQRVALNKFRISSQEWVD